MSQEFADLLFNMVVVLTWLVEVVCDDVEGWCSVHGYSFGFVLDVRAGGRMAIDKEENSRTEEENSG